MYLGVIVRILLVILSFMQVSQAALQPIYLGLSDVIKNRQVKFYNNTTDLTNKANGFTALTTNQPIVINGNFYFRPSIQNSNPQASKVQGLVVGFVNSTGVQNLDGAYNITWKCFGYKPNLTNVANTLAARSVTGNMQMNAPTIPGTYYMFVTNASYVKTTALSNIATLCQNQLNSTASDERLMDLQNSTASDAFNFTTYAPAATIKRLFNESGNLVTVSGPNCLASTISSVNWPASQSSKYGASITATNAMCANGIVRSTTTRTCTDNLDGTATWGTVSGPGCQATCTGPINNLNIGTIWSGDPSISYNAGAYGICKTDVPRNLTKSVTIGCVNTAAPGQAAGSFTFNSGATCAPRLSSYPTYTNLLSNNTIYVNPYNPLGNNGTYLNYPSPSNEYWSMGTFAYYRNLHLGADPTGTGIKPDNGNILDSWTDISGNMRDIDLRGGVNPIVWLSQSGGTLQFNKTVIFSNKIDMDGRFANNLRFQLYVSYQVLSDPVPFVFKPRYNVVSLSSPYLFLKIAYNKYASNNYHTVFGYLGPATWSIYPTVNCGILLDWPSAINFNAPTTAVIKDNGMAQIVYYGTNPATGCNGCKYCCWWDPTRGPAQYQSSALYNNAFSVPFHGGVTCQTSGVPYTVQDVGYGGATGLYLGDNDGTSNTGISAVIVVQPANHVNWWSYTTIRNCSTCGFYTTAMDNWGWDGCCLPGARTQNWNGNNFFYDMQMSNEQMLTFNIRKYLLKNNIGNYDSCYWTNTITGQSVDACW